MDKLKHQLTHQGLGSLIAPQQGNQRLDIAFCTQGVLRCYHSHLAACWIAGSKGEWRGRQTG